MFFSNHSFPPCSCACRWRKRPTWLVSWRRPRFSSWSPKATPAWAVSTRRVARTSRSLDLWFWLQAGLFLDTSCGLLETSSWLTSRSFNCFTHIYCIFILFGSFCGRWFWRRLHQQLVVGTVQTGPAASSHHQRWALHRRWDQDGRGADLSPNHSQQFQKNQLVDVFFGLHYQSFYLYKII